MSNFILKIKRAEIPFLFLMRLNFSGVSWQNWLTICELLCLGLVQLLFGFTKKCFVTQKA